MSDNNTILIVEGKMKSLALSLAGLLMTTLSVVIFFLAMDVDNGVKYFMYFVSVLGFLFFGYATLLVFKQVFGVKPVLILNSQGFINKKQMYTVEKELIPWRRVKKIEIRSLLNEDFVCIEIDNEEAYLEAMSKVMRMGAKTNMKMGYPAITLSATTLKKFDTESLNDLFNRYLEQYGK